MILVPVSHYFIVPLYHLISLLWPTIFNSDKLFFVMMANEDFSQPMLYILEISHIKEDLICLAIRY